MKLYTGVWRYLIRRLARSHGFLDPIPLLTRLERFSQPSEVAFPLELVRAGALFHARGLLNTKAIQHNLDWVWPYWVEEQFRPLGEAFIPRAFSVTHVNLTHRNWTAVGLPYSESYVVVDPRGLVMPFWDSWSLDFWWYGNNTRLLPSRALKASQRLLLDEGLAVETAIDEARVNLLSQVEVRDDGREIACHIRVAVNSPLGGNLVISARPYNPEGVSFLEEISRSADGRVLTVNRNHTVEFDSAPATTLFAEYQPGDVSAKLFTASPHDSREKIECRVGMATSASLFPVQGSREVQIRIPLEATKTVRAKQTWRQLREAGSNLKIPNERYSFLFDAAVSSLLLHSAEDVYPGPYTYKRFWFRDAAFILEALLRLGHFERVERVLDSFPKRQTVQGYFLSQEGEWDSNGAALWSYCRYSLLSGNAPKLEWRRAIIDGAEWILRKRVDAPEAKHHGLMPAGFSAEHLGPNDFYYWDNFWSVAGLESASVLCGLVGDHDRAKVFADGASAFRDAIEKSLRAAPPSPFNAIPASPYRRMDAGAIGSIAASYPLQLWSPDDPHILGAVRFLMQNSFVRGGFFQDMIHSGINAYLTLHIAQVLMRANDPRYSQLIEAVAELASPTGQWPEAIHPRTLGGCMGDGHHAWASAEWVIAMKNLFVLEEGDDLILGSGMNSAFIPVNATVELGPTHTKFGPIRVLFRREGQELYGELKAQWRTAPRRILVRPIGSKSQEVQQGETAFRLPLVA